MKNKKSLLNTKDYLEGTQSFYISEGIIDILSKGIEENNLNEFYVVIQNKDFKIKKNVSSFSKKNNVSFTIDVLPQEIKVLFVSNNIKCTFYSSSKEILSITNDNFKFKLNKAENLDNLYSAKITLKQRK